jgi:hypothetical protein
MRIKSKRGFLIVDAACCLPVFLIAIGMLLSFYCCDARKSYIYYCLSCRWFDYWLFNS